MRASLSACAFVMVVMPARALADSIVRLRVDVKNPLASYSMRVPYTGDYAISIGRNRAQVAIPGGPTLIFDLEKQVVSSLDASAKSFFQMKIGDYLAMGEAVPQPFGNRFSARIAVTLEPTVGQESRTILAHAASPYNLDLEAFLTRKTSQGFGGGGGRRRGGGVFGGGGGGGGGSFGDSGNSPSSAGCNVSGEVWLSSAPVADIDPGELDIVEACALMRGVPGLKGMTDRMRKAKLTPLGADFAVAILDANGERPATVPTVSVETTSIEAAQLDASLFTIPAGYVKVPAPPLPLGTTN